MTDTTAPRPPKEQAIALLAAYNTAHAALVEACAQTESEIAILTAALETTRAPHQAKLDALKQQAVDLGLAHILEIFGTTTSQLVSSGHALKKNTGKSVVCEDEAQTVEMLLIESGKEHLIQEAEPLEDEAAQAIRMAAQACLRIKIEINKEYVQALYKDNKAWFNARGIYLTTSTTVTLSPVPAKKTRPAKKTTPITPAETTNLEAA